MRCYPWAENAEVYTSRLFFTVQLVIMNQFIRPFYNQHVLPKCIMNAPQDLRTCQHAGSLSFSLPFSATILSSVSQCQSDTHQVSQFLEGCVTWYLATQPRGRVEHSALLTLLLKPDETSSKKKKYISNLTKLSARPSLYWHLPRVSLDHPLASALQTVVLHHVALLFLSKGLNKLNLTVQTEACRKA